MSQGLESIPRLLELETAKQILEEVFHARSSDIEDMIHRWLEERNCSEESCQEGELLVVGRSSEYYHPGHHIYGHIGHGNRGHHARVIINNYRRDSQS